MLDVLAPLYRKTDRSHHFPSFKNALLSCLNHRPNFFGNGVIMQAGRVGDLIEVKADFTDEMLDLLADAVRRKLCPLKDKR